MFNRFEEKLVAEWRSKLKLSIVIGPPELARFFARNGGRRERARRNLSLLFTNKNDNEKSKINQTLSNPRSAEKINHFVVEQRK